MLPSDPSARPLQPKLWELRLVRAVPWSGIEFLPGILCWCCEIRSLGSAQGTGQDRAASGVASPTCLDVKQPGTGFCCQTLEPVGSFPLARALPARSCCRNDLSKQNRGILPWCCPEAVAAPLCCHRVRVGGWAGTHWPVLLKSLLDGRLAGLLPKAGFGFVAGTCLTAGFCEQGCVGCH